MWRPDWKLPKHMPAICSMQPARAAALLGLVLLGPSYAVAADSEDVAEIRRMLRELQEQNRELSRRLQTLESSREAPAAQAQERRPSAAAGSPAWLSRWHINPPESDTPAADDPQARRMATQKRPAAETAARTPAAAASDAPAPLPQPRDTAGTSLEKRVKDLEVGWAVQEHATRQIIRDALTKTGPRINDFIALSGAVEVAGGRFQDFTGPTRDELRLSTAELDFDIKMGEWLTGQLVMGYDTGTNIVFPTLDGSTASVDRFNLDRTHIRVGNFERFPIAARVGREVLHFGTSTGVARLDTLSIGTPLTTEVFENRQTAAGLEFAWPTPPLQPPPPPHVVPKVRPLVVAPLVDNFMRMAGYQPLPQRVFPPAPVTPLLEPPPLYGSFMAYKGSDRILPLRNRLQDFNASLGYRGKGHCGRPYEELRNSLICPWHLDVHVDYNSSVFDSRFLEAGYHPFFGQPLFGQEFASVPGVAASIKAAFGPFAFVGEINSAARDVSFVDAFGVQKTIRPLAWQASLAYQFDWNPWVTEIGAQGTFVSVGYSRSEDMAGAIALVNGVPTRVGFVPQSRLFFTAGEWLMDGLKFVVEHQIAQDYPVSAGGTGKTVHGTFGLVSLQF